MSLLGFYNKCVKLCVHIISISKKSSCYDTADVRLSSASYQCMGEISSPEYIGALSISASAIILTRTVGGVTSFFCAVSNN